MSDALAIGRNEPKNDIEMLQANLAEKHKPLLSRRDELLAASVQWVEITDDDHARNVSDLAGRGGMLARFTKEADDQRGIEKSPHLQRAAAVDGFFNTTVTGRIIAEHVRLKAMLANWLAKKADEEKRRRQAEAERLRKEAAEKLAAAEKAERERLAEIERLREAAAVDVTANPNAPAPAAAAPAVPMTNVNKAIDEAVRANTAAENAEKRAAAKPAELSRLRGDLGSVSSLRRHWTGEMVNREQLDLEQLRQHLTVDDLNKAIRAWVKANSGDDKPAPSLRGARCWQENTL